MTSWFNINKLTVNTDKTYTMLISSQLYLDKDAPLSVNINGIPLVQRNEVIYLEVTIDSHLTWVPHINSICKKVAPKLLHFPDYDTFYHMNLCMLFILVSYFHP